MIWNLPWLTPKSVSRPQIATMIGPGTPYSRSMRSNDVRSSRAAPILFSCGRARSCAGKLLEGLGEDVLGAVALSVAGSSVRPSSAMAMVFCEMPWAAASVAKSASQGSKPLPHGAARDGPQIAMEISASAIDGNQVRMKCNNGSAIGDPQDVCRGPLGVTFHLRLSFIRCRP